MDPARGENGKDESLAIAENADEGEIRKSRERSVPHYKLREREREEQRQAVKLLDATERSADASHRSTRWAAWAAVIALAALVVSAWPFMKLT